MSAGGCNACEADANVLTTVGWDMGRFGIQFVASPRHADGLLVTGPVTKNMGWRWKRPGRPCLSRRSSSPPAHARFQADLIPTCRKCTDGVAGFCPWTCSSRDVRRTR